MSLLQLQVSLGAGEIEIRHISFQRVLLKDSNLKGSEDWLRFYINRWHRSIVYMGELMYSFDRRTGVRQAASFFLQYSSKQPTRWLILLVGIRGVYKSVQSIVSQILNLLMMEFFLLIIMMKGK